MKTILCFCLPLFFSVMLYETTAFAQTPLNWSSIVQLGSNGYNIRPRVAITDDNLPIIIFGNPDSAAIYKVKSTGTSFTAPQRITPNSVDAVTMTWQGPELAANGNIVFMTYKSSPETEQPLFTVKSSDAGLSFQNSIRVDYIGADISRFPCVDVLPNGNPVVSFMRINADFTNPRYVVANSIDGGLSYLSDVNASTSVFAGEVCDCCPASIIANSGTQVMSYRNNDNNVRDIKSVLSFNSGNTFSLGIAVDNTNWVINSCPSTGPDAVITGDSIVTVWKSGSTSQKVWVSSANINNSIIGTYGRIGDNGTIQNYPRIAGNGDTLGVVWEEKNGSQTYIKFTYSTVGAKGLFLNPVTISTSLQNQTKPDIAYRNGTFHVVWTDGISNKCAYSKATVPGSTSVNNSEFDSVNIFPSPFSNYFIVSVGKNFVSAQLTDISGKTVIEKSFENKNELQFATEKLKSGIYILTLSDKNNVKVVRRIIKE